MNTMQNLYLPGNKLKGIASVDLTSEYVCMFILMQALLYTTTEDKKCYFDYIYSIWQASLSRATYIYTTFEG